MNTCSQNRRFVYVVVPQPHRLIDKLVQWPKITSDIMRQHWNCDLFQPLRFDRYGYTNYVNSWRRGDFKRLIWLMCYYRQIGKCQANVCSSCVVCSPLVHTQPHECRLNFSFELIYVVGNEDLSRKREKYFLAKDYRYLYVQLIIIIIN